MAKSLLPAKSVSRLGDTIHPSEVDWVNEKIATATGIPLKFLYQGDAGREPTSRSLKMDLDAFTKLQRDNDTLFIFPKETCRTCGHEGVKEMMRPMHSISQKM